MSDINHPIDLKFKEFLMGNAPKTFLIGAGCSIDPPSCLPLGGQMSEAIVNYTCTESEIQKILILHSIVFDMKRLFRQRIWGKNSHEEFRTRRNASFRYDIRAGKSRRTVIQIYHHLSMSEREFITHMNVKPSRKPVL
ncbi:MAG: hypothetical protein ACFFD2_19700 [Promethearchaeota archaeon]